MIKWVSTYAVTDKNNFCFPLIHKKNIVINNINLHTKNHCFFMEILIKSELSVQVYVIEDQQDNHVTLQTSLKSTATKLRTNNFPKFLVN